MLNQFFHRFPSWSLVAIQVFALFFAERIDGITHGSQFDLGDFRVDFMRQDIDVVAKFCMVFEDVFGSQGLDSKRQVHDFSRMTVAGS